MARISYNDVDKYNSSGTYFTLKDNGDSAIVTILADSIEDLGIYVAHNIELEGSNPTINCLRDYDEPADNCPLCRISKRQVKVAIPLLVNGEVLVWSRSKGILEQIDNLAKRYKKLSTRQFEIVRNGATGSTKTTYSFFPLEESGYKNLKDALDNLSEEAYQQYEECFSKVITDWTFEEMEEYLETGKDPKEDSKKPTRRRSNLADRVSSKPIRRRGKSEEDNEEEEEESSKIESKSTSKKDKKEIKPIKNIKKSKKVEEEEQEEVKKPANKSSKDEHFDDEEVEDEDSFEEEDFEDFDDEDEFDDGEEFD